MTKWIDFYWLCLNLILLSPPVTNEPVYMWKTGNWRSVHSTTFSRLYANMSQLVRNTLLRRPNQERISRRLIKLSVLYWSARCHSWKTTPFIFFSFFFFNRFYSGSQHFASPDLNTAGKRRLRSSLTTIQLKFSGALKPNCSGACYGAQRAWKQNIKHENKTNPQLCSLVIGPLELLSCIAEYLHTLRVNNEQAEVGQEGCLCRFNRFTCHNSNDCGKKQTNKQTKRPFLTLWMNVSSVYLLQHTGATASRSR